VQQVIPSAKAVQSHYRAGVSLREMLLAAERDLILRALEDCGGHVSRTATALQIERSHLYKKMRGLGIDPRQTGEK
jgi:DNA-binding NtrC family response regulator